MRQLLVTLVVATIFRLGAAAAAAPAQQKAQQKTPPKATTPANSAAAVPDRAALLQQAAAAQKSGRTDEAMRLYRLAAERHQSVQGYLELARLQVRAGDSASASTSLSKARALAPNSEDVLAASAQVALAAKRPMPAVLALQSLTRICPTVAQYHYLLGVGLMAVGDMPSADEALRQANRLEPERQLTLLALGLVLNNRKQFSDAKEMLTRSVELQPDSLEATAALAEAQAGLGEFDSAALHARRVLDRAPSNATANLVIGLTMMEQKNYAAARDALQKAIATDPESPKAFYQLSLALARLGDEAGARQYVQFYQDKLRAVEERVNALRAGGASAPERSRPARVPR
jgi:tetratricopeptide (TPR) repeat protein